MPSSPRDARRRAVADLEPHEVGAAALERDVDLLAGDAQGVGVTARLELDVELVVSAVRMKRPPANSSDGTVSA